MSPLAQAACRTYRYLRLTLVGLVVLLTVSVIFQATTCGGMLGSISASYYTPVRSVFVGALIGIGAALIAVRGRPGPENAMLNLAGMAAGLIALVPTPRPSFVGTCGSGAAPTAADVSAAVGNNVTALLAVGVFGLGAAVLSTVHSPDRGWWTFTLALLLWVVVLMWFALWRESFVAAAHYAASALLFLLLSAVAVSNAMHARYQTDPPLLPAAAYRAVYWLVAAVMALTMITAGALFLADGARTGGVGGWMLPVEAVLVGAFALFWLAQTAQFWHTGVPTPDRTDAALRARR